MGKKYLNLKLATNILTFQLNFVREVFLTDLVLRILKKKSNKLIFSNARLQAKFSTSEFFITVPILTFRDLWMCKILHLLNKKSTKKIFKSLNGNKYDFLVD